MTKLALSALLAIGLSGCANTFLDSAPSQDGGRYVSGAYDGKAAIFYCPANSDDCDRVDVDFE